MAKPEPAQQHVAGLSAEWLARTLTQSETVRLFRRDRRSLFKNTRRDFVIQIENLFNRPNCQCNDEIRQNLRNFESSEVTELLVI